MADNQEHVNWMDAIFKRSKTDEELKKNPGYKKPIQKASLQGGIYESFLNTAKDAGYLPAWIRLQREIRAELSRAIKEDGTADPAIATEAFLEEINAKIKKYNLICPVPMQRTRIFRDSLERQYKSWE